MGRWSYALLVLVLTQSTSAFVPNHGCHSRPLIQCNGAMRSYTESLSRNTANQGYGMNQNTKASPPQSSSEVSVPAPALEVESVVTESFDYFKDNEAFNSAKVKASIDKERDAFKKAKAHIKKKVSNEAPSAGYQEVRDKSTSYQVVRDSLKEVKAKTQSEMNRVDYEKAKVRNKIEQMKAATAKRTRKVERELETHLKSTQALVDQEVVKMTRVLQAEIELETQRESQIVQQIASLEQSIINKKDEIRYYEDVAEEMVALRQKLKPGSGTSQLDVLLDQKLSVAQVEKGHLETLEECLKELYDLLADARSRSNRTREAKDHLIRENKLGPLTSKLENRIKNAKKYAMNKYRDVKGVTKGALNKVRDALN